MTASEERSPILDVRDLKVEFHTPKGAVQAVNGVSFSVDSGQTLGIVGESGCGKSTIALALMRLVADTGVSSGEVHFGGTDLMLLSSPQMRAVRGKELAMIFQDPMSALNPVVTLGKQIREALSVHTSLSRPTAQRRAVELLGQVGIPDPARRVSAYPYELSGGMRQRAMIAMAISCEPRLLIADEPTTALDVTVQAQILDLLSRLRSDLGMAIILVSHDLGVVAGMADSIQVMYSGYAVEYGSAEQVLLSARHPYTVALLKALVRIDEPRPDRLGAIPGSAPTLYSPAQECPFRSRCPEAHDACRTANPPLAALAEGRCVACWARTPVSSASPGGAS